MHYMLIRNNSVGRTVWMLTQLAYQADADECKAVCFLGRHLMMNARRSSADGTVCFLLSRPAKTQSMEY